MKLYRKTKDELINSAMTKLKTVFGGAGKPGVNYSLLFIDITGNLVSEKGYERNCYSVQLCLSYDVQRLILFHKLLFLLVRYPRIEISHHNTQNLRL